MRLRASRTPECLCPWCGHRLGASMAADPKKPDATPKPGDLTVCFSCAQVLVFTDDLKLRASMPGEIEDMPALRRAQQAARALDRRRMQ